MMRFDERPQLPLTSRRKILSTAGAGMLLLQVAGAASAAPALTEAGGTRLGAMLLLWAFSIAWSAVAVLLLVRQADLPDTFTASLLATISSCAAFTLVAALNRRGTTAEVNVVDTLFFGVTVGALTGLIVWGIAIALARLLRLPTTAGLHESK